MTARIWLVVLVALGIEVAYVSLARADVARFAVVIGNDAGVRGETRLRFAESDATKMAEVLTEVGGYPPENITVLRGSDATSAQNTIIAINDRIRSRATRGDGQAVLFVYYSGHADRHSLHLGDSRLSLSVLEQLVRGSAADLRLLIVDACQSGAITRVKGGRSAAPMALAFDERLAGDGVIFLTASSASEDAQESDELRGSFFTHYLVSGLLGAADANQDGMIVLKEAYRHAYDRTIQATSLTQAGIQHPTFRYEIGGHGDFVLARLRVAARQSAVVEFPSGRDYLLMRTDRNGPVIVEVAEHDKARTVTLKAGVYFVRARGPNHLLEGRVDLAPGRTTRIRDDGLERIEYARLVRKGAAEASVHGPSLGYQARTAIVDGASTCHGPMLGYTVELPWSRLGARLGACRGGFQTEALRATTDELHLGLRAAKAWDLQRRVTVDLGLGAGAAVLRESFETRGLAPTRWASAAYVEVGASIIGTLPAGLWLGGELSLRGYGLRIESDDKSTLRLRPALHSSLSLGLYF